VDALLIKVLNCWSVSVQAFPMTHLAEEELPDERRWRLRVLGAVDDLARAPVE